MRHYETLFIVTPELAEEEVGGVIDKFAGILSERNAVMAKIDNWGRRRLAYDVKKFSKGYFVLFDFGAPPAAVDEMERQFKIDEQIIRFMTVKLDDHFDPETMIKPVEEPSAPEDQEDEENPKPDDSDEDEVEDGSDEEDSSEDTAEQAGDESETKKED
jgi:small subunit ribosomal protein S6